MPYQYAAKVKGHTLRWCKAPVAGHREEGRRVEAQGFQSTITETLQWDSNVDYDAGMLATGVSTSALVVQHITVRTQPSP